MSDPAEVDRLLADQASSTTSRRRMGAAHPRFEEVSPEVGHLDEGALAALLDEEPDEAAALLAELARATDPELRAQARALAGRLLVPPPPPSSDEQRAGLGRVQRNLATGDELDIDATIGSYVDLGGRVGAGDLRFEGWRRPAVAYVLLVDASGSVTGAPLATAVMTAAALAARVGSGGELAVVAFWSRAVVLRHMATPGAPATVIDRLLDLRGGDVTDLAGGLRAALAQAALARASRRELLVLTDGLANEGDDPLPLAASAARSGTRLHVLALSDEPEAQEACASLAGVGGGRVAPLLRPSHAAGAVGAVLAR